MGGRVLLLCLLVAPALGQEADSEKRFAPVPAAVRSRLIERLNQFLEYDRTGQNEKKFDLLSKYYLSVVKWTKADYTKFMQDRAAQGKGEKIIDFKISSVENFSLGDSPDQMIFNIYGRAKFSRGKKTKSEKRLLDARYENGDWYFSDWLIEYVNY